MQILINKTFIIQFHGAKLLDKLQARRRRPFQKCERYLNITGYYLSNIEYLDVFFFLSQFNSISQHCIAKGTS